MRFWDSSALLALLLEEQRSSPVLALLHEDPQIAVWCLTEVEMESGIARRLREGLDPEDAHTARSRLGQLLERWHEVVSLEGVRRRATRLLRSHALSAADALQLGAALLLCGERPDMMDFVCLDDRLAAAASREGFQVLP
jgi:hypothetical protein